MLMLHTGMVVEHFNYFLKIYLIENEEHSLKMKASLLGTERFCLLLSSCRFLSPSVRADSEGRLTCDGAHSYRSDSIYKGRK